MDPAGRGENGVDRGQYRFDDIVVDAAAHSLSRAGVVQPVEPKAFAVLLALLQRPGELIGRDDLLDRVWGHRHVTPGVLTRAIAQLRHALDDDSQQPRYIQTRHALGYCFIGELQAEAEAGAAIAHATQVSDAANADAAMQSHAASVQGAASGISDGSLVPDEMRLNAHRDPAQPPIALDSGPHRERDVHFRWKSPWLAAAALAATALACWALLAPSPAPPGPAEASIAVMPFTSLSSDRNDDYFAEGLAEEMRDALAGVKGLKVAASISPAARNDVSDAKALGKKLGVATILDASVRREGSRLRISARLADTSTGFTLWSHTYDRELSGVFATQSEIASEVVHSLLGAIPDEDMALEKRLTPTRNVAAFDDYLKGLQQLLLTNGKNNEEQAIGFFGQALHEDVGFARAQAGICRSRVSGFEDRHNAQDFELAHAACLRAQKLDPGLGEVNLAMGDLYQTRGDMGKATEYYLRAESDPAQRPAAYLGMGLLLADQGHGDQALDYFRRALALRPGDADINAQIGYRRYLAGDMPGAIEFFRKALALRPDDADRWSALGGVYLTTGNNAAASQALERSIAIKPNYAALSNLAEIKYQSGQYAQAVDLYRRAIALDSTDFMAWGNLGEALLANPATVSRAKDAFREAAGRAQSYVGIKSSDAKALAALGWYRANLGESSAARELIKRSEALGGEPVEVALFNAMTFTRLGDGDQARQRVAAARAGGIAEKRIMTNVVLGRADLGPIEAGHDRARLSAQRTSKGHTPGESRERESKK